MPNFQDPTVRPGPLGRIMLRGPRREPLHLDVDIDNAVFAPLSQEADEIAEMRVVSQERLG
jgi:hypothetical protein